MSVSIRLAKFGKRHAPTYRVVAAHTKTKRNGKFLDILGFYNPIDKNSKFTLNKEKYDNWVSKGAIISNAVKQLVEGNYNYIKYEPKSTKPGEASPAVAAEV